MNVTQQRRAASPPDRIVPPAPVAAVIESWRRGEPPDAVGYLASHPELQSDCSVVIMLAYEEYALRLYAGETIDVPNFVDRFPVFRREVRLALDLHSVVEEETGEFDLEALTGSERPIDWPSPGETFLGFRLLRPLGRGSFARVFLARERELGDRLVAVKLSRLGTTEARTLGPLTHPGIVHVYSVKYDKTKGIAAVCMDYIEGVPLARAIGRAHHRGQRPQRAGALLAGCPLPQGKPTRGPAFRNLAYIEGCVQIGAQVADTLAHLHGLGIVHADLKPANVMLRPNGQPVLLDFNLAFASREGRIWVGGTPAYMAPEQLLASIGPDIDAPGKVGLSQVGSGSDLFALGILLYEMLTGQYPFGEIPHQAPLEVLRAHLLQSHLCGCRPLRECNPQVDPGLARLVESCLAFRPEDRPTNDAVAADLRRWYSRPDRRVARWLRRTPRLQVGAAILTVVLVLGLALPFALGAGAPDALARGNAALQRGDAAAAVASFDRALQANPNNVEALLGRGRARLELAKEQPTEKQSETIRQALEDLRRARAPRPDDGRLHAALGYALNRSRDHRGAHEHYRCAIDARFTNAAVYNNLGYTCLSLRQPDAQSALPEAEQNLKLAITLDPTLRAAWHNLALVDLMRATSPKERDYVPRDGVANAREALRLGAAPELSLDAARLCARAADRTIGEESKTYRAAALEHARQAIDLKADPGRLKDHLFNSLQGDPAFQKLRDSAPPVDRPAPTLRLVDPLAVPSS